MKRLYALFKTWSHKLRNYVSPVFLILLAISFTLWYISKLNYTYTTDMNIKVKVDGEQVVVPCVVEGKGTNLLGYGFYTSQRVSIPLSELDYDIIEKRRSGADSLVCDYNVRISPISMQNAISVRFSDLKIVSVGDFDEIPLSIK